MVAVLTKTSAVSCLHQGMVQTDSTSPLRVQGAAVLVQTSIQDRSIIGCTTTPPPSANQPCRTVASVSGGGSQKLRVKGQPAMLQTLAGITNGIVGGPPPQPLAPAQARQNRLQAI